jgi:hypothetical protein
MNQTWVPEEECLRDLGPCGADLGGSLPVGFAAFLYIVSCTTSLIGMRKTQLLYDVVNASVGLLGGLPGTPSVWDDIDTTRHQIVEMQFINALLFVNLSCCREIGSGLALRGRDLFPLHIVNTTQIYLDSVSEFRMEIPVILRGPFLDYARGLAVLGAFRVCVRSSDQTYVRSVCGQPIRGIRGDEPSFSSVLNVIIVPGLQHPVLNVVEALILIPCINVCVAVGVVNEV